MKLHGGPRSRRAAHSPLKLDLLVCLLSLVCLTTRPAWATWHARGVTLEWMFRATGYAFAGTVTRSVASRDSLSGWVVTKVTFRDLRMAYGDATGDSLEVQFLGGVLDGRPHDLEVQPRFEVGERYVALIGPSLGRREDLYLPAVGDRLGVFRVFRGASGDSNGVETLNGEPVLGITDDVITVGGAPRDADDPIQGSRDSGESRRAMTESELLGEFATRIPRAKANRWSPVRPGAPEMAKNDRILGDVSRKRDWVTAITAVGRWSGDEAMGVLDKFIWRRYSGQIDTDTFRAMLVAVSALQWTDREPNPEIVVELAKGIDPDYWKRLPWTHSIEGSTQAARVLMSQVAINGLSSTGTEYAESTLVQLLRRPFHPRQVGNVAEGLERNRKVRAERLAAIHKGTDPR